MASSQQAEQFNAIPGEDHVHARELLLESYRWVRAYTESLAAPLSAEDQMLQAMAEASPTKWHRAHSSWFFETFILQRHETDFRWHEEAYCYLFNSYYNSIGEQYPRPRRGLISRPDCYQVTNYRREIDQRMQRLLQEVDDGAFEQLAPLLLLGLNHEQQHQELLLTDIKLGLSINPVRPSLPAVAARFATGEPGWLEFAGGMVEIGAVGNGFHFDNEGPRHSCSLPPFSIATAPVSAAHYLQFIEDGGYRNPLLWLSDGWAFINQHGITSPLYWESRDDEWWRYSLEGMRPLESDAPLCHISYYEADAFATWAGARLPTEQEWEYAISQATGELAYPPEDLLLGQVWEWTRSAYSAYPGYTPAAGAVGEYNGKFMANQMVLRGWSRATAPGHSRLSYRNFFYPDARWQYAGLRLAR